MIVMNDMSVMIVTIVMMMIIMSSLLSFHCYVVMITTIEIVF